MLIGFKFTIAMVLFTVPVLLFCFTLRCALNVLKLLKSDVYTGSLVERKNILKQLIGFFENLASNYSTVFGLFYNIYINCIQSTLLEFFDRHFVSINT